MEFSREWTRRTFLQSVGAAVPTVKLMLGPATAGAAALGGWPNELDSIKFTPVDLSNHFTASPSDFGPRERAKGLSSESAQDGFIRTRAGKQTLRGIPFLLGPEGVQKRSWVVLSNRKNAWVTQSVEIPLNRKTGFICLAQFNDWDPNETPPPEALHRRRQAYLCCIFRPIPKMIRFVQLSPKGFRLLPSRSRPCN